MISYQATVVRLDNARHHGPVRPASAISLIVLHATADRSDAIAVIQWMNSDEAPPVSYHYVVGRVSNIYRMCAPMYVAYHAGASAWPVPATGVPLHASVNRISIGVSFANDNAGEPLTDWQRAAGLWLCVTLARLYRIPASRVVRHRDVAPGRKTDIIPTTLDLAAWQAAIAAELQGGANVA